MPKEIKKLQIGDQFPVIEAEQLDFKKIKIPDDLKGKRAVLATGFSMEAQLPINTWTEYMLTNYPATPYYEIPIGNQFYAFISRSIDNAMRREVPKELHSKTATYYGSLCEQYRKMFDVRDNSTCYVFILDVDCDILYKTQGPITDKVINDLRNILK